MNRTIQISLAMIGLMIVTVAHGHDQIPGAPQTKPVLITGAIVHTVDGDVIKNGSVLFANGKIAAVGKKIKAPKKAITIDACGKHVYPGLIEPLTDLGLREISAVDATDDRREFGSLNPNARAIEAINPDSELIPVARANGVLFAVASPQGRWLRGQAALIQLDGWTAGEMSLVGTAGLSVDWSYLEPNDTSADGRISKRKQRRTEFADLLTKARQYQANRKATPNQTPTDVRLESLLPVINRKLPLIAQADELLEIESAVAFAQEHDLRLIIFGGYDAADCAGLLRKYDVPVMISGVHRLPMRRNDAYDAPYTLAKRLSDAKVRYCIGGAGAGSPNGAAAARNLPYHAATAVAYGLSPDEAIKRITLATAEIFGVDKQIGSITPGKDATLFMSDGDIMEGTSNVTDAWIQGRVVDLSSRHTMLYDKYRKKYQRGSK